MPREWRDVSPPVNASAAPADSRRAEGAQMRHLWMYAALVCIGATCECAVAGQGREVAPPPRLRGDREPPADWKIAELNALFPRPEDKGTVTILVWQSIDFNGAIERVDRCLVLKQYAKPQEGKAVALGYFLRRPDGSKPNWSVWGILFTGTEHERNGWVDAIELYPRMPPDEQLSRFLQEFWWKGFSSPGGILKRPDRNGPSRESKIVKYAPQLVAGGVCHRSWVKLFEREGPMQLFPEMDQLFSKAK